MKRNWVPKLALVVVVLTMVSTSLVSGTFAKYTTGVSSTDKARVAYWGFGTTAAEVELDLFDGTYTNVVSKDTSNVIAPGTSKTVPFAIVKAATAIPPEVGYTFKVDTTGSSLTASIAANTNIQWQLDSEGWGTWDDMITAIEALDGTGTFAAGAIPTGFEAGASHTVSWQWAFEDDAGTLFTNQDTTDTAMGNLATAEATLKVAVTATQID